MLAVFGAGCFGLFLGAKAYGDEFHFLLNFSGLQILLPSMRQGCFMFLKSSGLSFFNSVYFATSMQQSAFLRQLIADVTYWILFFGDGFCCRYSYGVVGGYVCAFC